VKCDRVDLLWDELLLAFPLGKYIDILEARVLELVI
jgi:hypothetical protein